MAAAAPIEYCLILANSICMPRGDWAAWAQTIGSILGLFVAIAVPLVLFLLDRKERQRRAKIQAAIATERLRFNLESMLTNCDLIRQVYRLYQQKAMSKFRP